MFISYIGCVKHVVPAIVPQWVCRLPSALAASHFHLNFSLSFVCFWCWCIWCIYTYTSIVCACMCERDKKKKKEIVSRHVHASVCVNYVQNIWLELCCFHGVHMILLIILFFIFVVIEVKYFLQNTERSNLVRILIMLLFHSENIVHDRISRLQLMIILVIKCLWTYLIYKDIKETKTANHHIWENILCVEWLKQKLILQLLRRKQSGV